MVTEKYCNHCELTHPLTSEYWYRLNASPRCKIKSKLSRKSKYDSAKQAAYMTQYRKANHKYLNEKNTEWRIANAEKHKANAREWYYKNRDHVQAVQQQYKKDRRQIDPAFKLTCNLRTRMYSVLKGKHKIGSAIKDLGCDTSELVKHLESQFESGMSWENYGTKWEVDHVLPLANYQLTDRGTYRRLAHYTNLQPMWMVHNRSKSNKE